MIDALEGPLPFSSLNGIANICCPLPHVQSCSQVHGLSRLDSALHLASDLLEGVDSAKCLVPLKSMAVPLQIHRWSEARAVALALPLLYSVFGIAGGGCSALSCSSFFMHLSLDAKHCHHAVGIQGRRVFKR